MSVIVQSLLALKRVGKHLFLRKGAESYSRSCRLGVTGKVALYAPIEVG